MHFLYVNVNAQVNESDRIVPYKGWMNGWSLRYTEYYHIL